MTMEHSTSGAFARRLGNLLNAIETRPIDTPEEREEVFRLRYSAYRAEKTVPWRKDERLHDRFDDLPNVRLFGLYVDGRLASSVRIHVASADHPHSPATDVFADILGPRLEDGAVVVDPTRLVSNSSIQLPGLSYLTVRLGMVASEHFDADLGLATVREEHRAFYRRTFFLDELSDARMYPGLARPIVMMGKSFAAAGAPTYERYPFMRSTREEREALFGPLPIPSAAMRRLPVTVAA